MIENNKNDVFSFVVNVSEISSNFMWMKIDLNLQMVPKAPVTLPSLEQSSSER